MAGRSTSNDKRMIEETVHVVAPHPLDAALPPRRVANGKPHKALPLSVYGYLEGAKRAARIDHPGAKRRVNFVVQLREKS